MDQKVILPKVFSWMFIGLLITFFTGYVVSINPNMLINVLSSGLLWVIIILEFGLVIFLSARITKMKPTTAKLCFILYAFVNGLTFSSVFVIYDLVSVMYTFLVTALLFGLFALIGMKTKLDLTKFGTYLIMALIGVLVCTLINIFLNSSSFDLVISIIIILIFIGFTAHDTQKILRLYEMNVLGEENLAIYGALELYLDFINLFLEIIQYIGKNKD